MLRKRALAFFGATHINGATFFDLSGEPDPKHAPPLKEEFKQRVLMGSLNNPFSVLLRVCPGVESISATFMHGVFSEPISLDPRIKHFAHSWAKKRLAAE